MEDCLDPQHLDWGSVPSPNFSVAQCLYYRSNSSGALNISSQVFEPPKIVSSQPMCTFHSECTEIQENFVDSEV